MRLHRLPLTTMENEASEGEGENIHIGKIHPATRRDMMAKRDTDCSPIHKLSCNGIFSDGYIFNFTSSNCIWTQSVFLHQSGSRS